MYGEPQIEPMYLLRSIDLLIFALLDKKLKLTYRLYAIMFATIFAYLGAIVLLHLERPVEELIGLLI